MVEYRTDCWNFQINEDGSSNLSKYEGKSFEMEPNAPTTIGMANTLLQFSTPYILFAFQQLFE